MKLVVSVRVELLHEIRCQDLLPDRNYFGTRNADSGQQTTRVGRFPIVGYVLLKDKLDVPSVGVADAQLRDSVVCFSLRSEQKVSARKRPVVHSKDGQLWAVLALMTGLDQLLQLIEKPYAGLSSQTLNQVVDL